MNAALNARNYACGSQAFAIGQKQGLSNLSLIRDRILTVRTAKLAAGNNLMHTRRPSSSG